MSNPVATIGDTIPQPADPKVTRVTFAKVEFDSQEFFLYGEGQFDPTYATFDPSGKGERFYMMVPLVDSLLGKPDFVSQDAWDDTVKNSASVFVTAVKSVMPKLVTPSEILVDNGISTPGKKMWAYDGPDNLFNWTGVFNGVTPGVSDAYDYWHLGGLHGAQYVTLDHKGDANDGNSAVLTLANPAAPRPTGDWLAADSSDLVVGGAFTMMFNVTPMTEGLSNPTLEQDNPWSITMEFGDVTMELNSTGAMRAKVDPDDSWTTVNLAAGKAKEGPPQQERIEDKDPFIITVYPVWNGIVVVNGVQDARPTVGSASYFVRKLKGPSVLESPYSTGFDPTAPSEVLVGVGSGATSVLVDFGATMTVTVKNCLVDMCYLPCFFVNSGWFDEWVVTTDDIPGTVEFHYDIYPIWTKNGTAMTLGRLAPPPPQPEPDVTQSTYVGPLADTHYSYVRWRMEQAAHNRFSGEVFGFIFEVEEERDFPVRNSNGHFALAWTGGSPGDPSTTGDWRDYITGINVTISLDGSSGSLTVDKYGVAGQHAEATQDIGAITINMTGGNGTVGGSIFQGLAMGVSDSKSVDGATWNVPLVGLEKKMDDIMLINVPFFDGETFFRATSFLCTYVGIISDYGNAPNAVIDRLGQSEEVNVARYDWKSGTTIRSAFDDIMSDLGYNYVVRDGKIYFYELDLITGLPLLGGIDRSVGYTNTKVITDDRSPDFDDIRNEIVVIGLEAVPSGRDTDIQKVPTFPRVELRRPATTPDVPWAKSMVRSLSGYLPIAQISDAADRLVAESRTYKVLGSVTIPGNASIKPYDRWGSAYIYSVTHSVDLVSKSWTTSLELYE